MIGALAVFIGLSGGLVPAEMAEVVAGRLRALDQLIVDVTLESYGGLCGTPSLDPAAWGRELDSVPLRLTIGRPNLRVEFLKDDEARGHEPVVACVVDGTYTSRHVRPRRPDGRIVYTVAWGRERAGVLWGEVLQPFDLGLFHCPALGGLNTATVLRHPSAKLVRDAAGVSTYAASLPLDGYSVHVELDLDPRGTPLRLKTIADFDSPNAPSACCEQFLVRTTEVNGELFPVETVTTFWGLPDHWSVSRVLVNSVETRPELARDDLRIEVDRRQALVIESFPDGRRMATTYDDVGEVISRDVYDPAEAAAATQRNTRWRRAVPPVAAVVGFSTALLLTFLSRAVVRR